LEYTQRLKLKYKELSSDYDKFSKELAKLLSNTSVKNPVSQFQTDNKFISKLSRFAFSISGNAKLTSSLALSTETILHERIKEWVRYTKAAQQFIDRYAEASDKYNQSITELNKKKAILDQIYSKNKSGQSGSDNDKIQKIQLEVINAQTDMERLKEIQGKTHSEFWNEIASFDRYKMLEISHWMDYYSQQHFKELSAITKTWSVFPNHKD